MKDKFVMLKELDNLAGYLKGRYELRGVYGIRVFREHYGIIFNKFAEWVLKTGRKFEVNKKSKDIKGKATIWVDDSREDDIGLKELESDDAMTANTMDEWGEDMDEQGWPLVSKVKKDILEGQESILAVSKSQKELSQKIIDSGMISTQLLNKVSVIEQVLNKTLDNQAKLVVRVSNLENGS